MRFRTPTAAASETGKVKRRADEGRDWTLVVDAPMGARVRVRLTDDACSPRSFDDD